MTTVVRDDRLLSRISKISRGAVQVGSGAGATASTPSRANPPSACTKAASTGAPATNAGASNHGSNNAANPQRPGRSWRTDER